MCVCVYFTDQRMGCKEDPVCFSDPVTRSLLTTTALREKERERERERGRERERERVHVCEREREIVCDSPSSEVLFQLRPSEEEREKERETGLVGSPSQYLWYTTEPLTCSSLHTSGLRCLTPLPLPTGTTLTESNSARVEVWGFLRGGAVDGGSAFRFGIL